MTSEQDIELLESYLDGQVSGAEKVALDARMASNAELAASMASLRQQRDLRMQAWTTYESSGDSADRIVAALQKRAEHRAWYVRILDYRQQIATAAACIAVFLIGWQWGHDAGTYRMMPNAVTPAQSVGLITQQQIPTGQSSVFEVRLTDPSGKLLRTERFRTLEEAQRFIAQIQKEMQAKP